MPAYAESAPSPPVLCAPLVCLVLVDTRDDFLGGGDWTEDSLLLRRRDDELSRRFVALVRCLGLSDDRLLLRKRGIFVELGVFILILIN